MLTGVALSRCCRARVAEVDLIIEQPRYARGIELLEAWCDADEMITGESQRE